MVAGVRLLTGLIALCLVELGSIAEREFVTAQRQLMVVMTALPMVQATPKQKTATPIHAQVRSSLSMSETSEDKGKKLFNCRYKTKY